MVLFNSEYNQSYGYAWIAFRILFVLVGIGMAFWLFTGKQNKQYLNQVFLAKNKKLYGFVAVCLAFNPNLTPMLPWLNSVSTEMTMGFPTISIFYLTSFMSVFESLVLTIINTSFAIDQHKLFSQSSMEQFEFAFALAFTFLNGLIALIECLFVEFVKDEVRTYSSTVEMNGPTANPVHNIRNDVESVGSVNNQQAIINELSATIRNLQDEVQKVKDASQSEKERMKNEKYELEERLRREQEQFENRLNLERIEMEKRFETKLEQILQRIDKIDQDKR